jgi:alpha-glucuronidase
LQPIQINNFPCFRLDRWTMAFTFCFNQLVIKDLQIQKNMISASLIRNPLLFLFIFVCSFSKAEDGYRLWLRYDAIQDATKRKEYLSAVKYIVVEKTSPVLGVAVKELNLAVSGLLGTVPLSTSSVQENGVLILGTPEGSKLVASLNLGEKLKSLGDEGFYVTSTLVKGKKFIVIAANKDL